MYIIPKPKEMTLKEEKIKAREFSVRTDDEGIRRFCFGIPCNDAGTVIKFTKEDMLSGEQYRIKINSEGVCISYGTAEGAYRAVSTFKQIIAQCEDGELTCLEIFDFPSIKNRGYMLDISRGKIPKLEYLKRLADILSDLKYNQLQLYMENFVFEFKNFKKYCRDTQPLTANEIKELDEYCRERFITLVPNLNGFGHMAAWTQKEEFAHLAITNEEGNPSSTLNPQKKECLELLDKLYDGFFENFSTDYVHIGMDEPFELGLNETKEICEKEGIGKVYTDYLNKVCRLIKEKYGKKPMFWDDIVFKHPEQLANIPKDAVVMEWGYETEQHFDRNCRRLKEHNLKFYVCPGTSMWGSICGRTNNAVLNIISAAECGEYYGADGFLLTEWGDGGNPQFPGVSYFPLVFGGAVSWNCGSHNHDIAYDERISLIGDCKKYLDKYIYKTKDSLADIVYRMGNYYLLESCLQFNGTRLNKCLSKADEITEEDKKAFARVKDYMENLKQELSNAEAEEIMLREIKEDCEIVIILLNYVCGKAADKDDVDALKKEFVYLWNMKNHSIGSEIFLDELDKCVSE